MAAGLSYGITLDVANEEPVPSSINASPAGSTLRIESDSAEDGYFDDRIILSAC